MLAILIAFFTQAPRRAPVSPRGEVKAGAERSIREGVPGTRNLDELRDAIR